MSAHSIALGTVIYVFTERFLNWMGFDSSNSLFYPRQSGIFLIILGIGYAVAAADLRRQSLVTLAILSKALAVLFLFSEALIRDVSSSVLLAGAGDMVLGGVALLLAIMFYRGKGTALGQNVNE